MSVKFELNYRLKLGTYTMKNDCEEWRCQLVFPRVFYYNLHAGLLIIILLLVIHYFIINNEYGELKFKKKLHNILET